MFNSIFSLFKAKKKAKNEDNSDEIAGFIPAFDDIEDFKRQHNLTCSAKSIGGLIKYLESRPNQKWYVFKSLKRRPYLINVGVYEEFPSIDIALEWFENYGGGKYYVKPLSLGKCKIGCYEFEGEDKEPDDEEEAVKSSRKLRLKYKPRDFREALLLQRLEEGDEQLIQKVTDAELSRQGIVSNDGACAIQPQGVDIKEHFDEITELKEEIHKKDMQYMEEIRKKDMLLLEERFKKGEKSSGWDAFMRMLETDTGKELGREALDTLKEIFKTASSGKEDVEVEKFEDFKDKSLTPAKEQAKKQKPRRDFTPLKIMCKFIEADGDPSAYLENMSIAYPEHPFCQTLIACENIEQFLGKLKPLEQKLPILFGDKGKAWLEELFTIIKEFKNRESLHKPITETGNKADTEEEFNSDADALQKNQKVESV